MVRDRAKDQASVCGYGKPWKVATAWWVTLCNECGVAMDCACACACVLIDVYDTELGCPEVLFAATSKSEAEEKEVCDGWESCG